MSTVLPAENGLPTPPGRAWFTDLRIYGPLEAWFDASWTLPDIQAAWPGRAGRAT